MASYAMTRSGLYAPRSKQKYELNNSVPNETLNALRHIVNEYELKRDACRTPELQRIANLMDGGDEAIDDESFPQPDGYDPSDWAEIRSRLMVLVNLLKASVRKVRSRVYGGYQHRSIVANPYQDDIEAFISGWFPAEMRDWFTNRLAFSNAPCIVQGKASTNGKHRLKLWLPDPCYTYLVPDPDDPREYVAMAEFSQDGDSFHFVTKNSEGRICKGESPVLVETLSDVPSSGSYVFITGQGFFPGVIAHGESRRNRRRAYSAPPFRDAYRFTVRASDTMFNGSLLQKVQTKGLLAVSGIKEDQTFDFAEMMRQGIIYLDENGKMQFVTPTSNIGDTLSLLDRLIEVYSVVSAIPVDDLNPTSAKGTSAEEAQRRAEPHVSLTREFAEIATLDEQELILRATAVIAWMDTKGPVDIDALRDKVETDISLQPPLKPLSSQSDAQIAMVGYSAGSILPEDFARMWNPYGNMEKIKSVLGRMETAKKAATQPGQDPTKTKNSQNTDLGNDPDNTKPSEDA